MKKITFTLMALLFIGLVTNAQVVFEDDFESYNVGDYVADNSATWTTWSDNPGSTEDALITDDYASSPSQSMIIQDDGSGANDMVLPLGNKTSGKYVISFYVYVESGTDEAYYNIQHFETVGTEWAFNAWFLNDGTGYIEINSQQHTFSYTQDSWVFVKHIIDIDNDEATLYVEGNEILTWQFSMQPFEPTGTNQLGAMNFWAGTESTGATAKYYIDDVKYEMYTPIIFEDDFEAYTAGDMVAENSSYWTTWSGTGGGADDAVVSTDYANSPVNSMLINDGGADDMILPLGDKTSGAYKVTFDIYVESGGFEGYYNFQHFETPGTEWAFDVFYYTDGTAELSTDGNMTGFTYTQDAWNHMEHYINLDADTASLFIDGMHVHTWTFSTQSGGGAGTNQLGGIDFYAWSDQGTGKYYVDDVKYEEWDPSVIFTDDFESYNVGDFVALNSNYWTTWSGTGGGADDAVISNDYANSPSQSMIINDGGADDMIFPFGNKTSGLYYVAFDMYVESGGYEGYYNFQHFETPGTEWAFDVFFYTDGTAELSTDGNMTGFTYTQDAWNHMEHYIDLSQDTAALFVDGTHIHTWTFSTQSGGGAGTNQLGGIDFYAWSDQGTGKYYVDDIMYKVLSSAPPPPEYTVTFNVMDPNANPIEGATVSIDGNDITTDASGVATIDLPDGDYDYTVTATGYLDATGTVTVAGEPVSEDVTLDPVYTATFTVTNSSGDPLDADISINGEELSTNPVGVATIDLPNGTYDYIVTSTGYLDYESSVTIDNAPVSIDVEMDGINISEVNIADFNIYPNPSKGTFKICTQGYYELTIHTSTGSIVHQSKDDGNSIINLESQAPGIYFLRIKNNNTIINKKIVIE